MAKTITFYDSIAGYHGSRKKWGEEVLQCGEYWPVQFMSEIGMNHYYSIHGGGGICIEGRALPECPA